VHAGGNVTKEASKSSFLKKEARNFCSGALINWGRFGSSCLSADRLNISFLVLFFKKEHFLLGADP
jgi:hypothetical protein